MFIIGVKKTSNHIVSRGIDLLRLIISCLFIEGRCFAPSRNVVSYPQEERNLKKFKIFKSFKLVLHAPAFLLSCVQTDGFNRKYTFEINVKNSC